MLVIAPKDNLATTISKSRGGRHRILPWWRINWTHRHSTIVPTVPRLLRRRGPIKAAENVDTARVSRNRDSAGGPRPSVIDTDTQLGRLRSGHRTASTARKPSTYMSKYSYSRPNGEATRHVRSAAMDSFRQARLSQGLSGARPGRVWIRTVFGANRPAPTVSQAAERPRKMVWWNWSRIDRDAYRELLYTAALLARSHLRAAPHPQIKSKRGIKTPQQGDIELVKRRLRYAERDYAQRIMKERT